MAYSMFKQNGVDYLVRWQPWQGGNGPLGGDASLVTLIHMSIISVPMLGFHMAPDEVRHESILLSGPPLLNG